MSVSLRCYSTSLGCPKNRVDTERLLGSLGVALVPVESPDEAELVFINTCAFIQPATEESVAGGRRVSRGALPRGRSGT